MGPYTEDAAIAKLDKPFLTDTATSVVSLLFALSSLATIGRASVTCAGFTLDRGIVYAAIFVIVSVVPWIIPLLFGRSSRPVIRWLRLFYVQFFYALFFSEAIHISNLLYRGRSFDELFVRFDQMLFGFQPALEFYKIVPDSPIIVELLFFAYASFFFLFSVGIWILFFRGKEIQAQRFLASITVGYYILYLFYIAYPVAGPKYFFTELRSQWYDPFQGYLFTGIMKKTFDSMDLFGAAFPSSHAAISTLALLLNFKYQRIVGYVTLPVTIVLLFSTVYIYAHYAVDTFAGTIVGVAFFFILPPVLKRIETFHSRAILKIRCYRKD